VARGVKLNKKQEEKFRKSDYPMVDFNIEWEVSGLSVSNKDTTLP
jgi:hypothetical protein